MPDEPISALTLIAAPTGTPPYPTAFTNPSTGAMLEILDTTNTSMASTGTNSKIAPGDLLAGFLAAGSNVTLTETSGIVTIAASGGGGMSVGSAVSGGSNHATLVEDGSGNLAALAIGSTGQVLTVASGAPTWAAPVTATTEVGQLSAIVSLTGSMTTIGNGLTVNLPVAGTYLLTGFALVNVFLTGTANQYGYVNAQLYNTTKPEVVPNSFANLIFAEIATTGTNIDTQLTAPIGPAIYAVTVPTQIDVQCTYGGTGIGSIPSSIQPLSNGGSVLNAIRIA